MKRHLLCGCVVAAFLPVASTASDTEGRTFKVDRSMAAEYKKADASSPGLASQLVATWEKYLRKIRGWDDAAIAHFGREMRGMPSDTLKAALEVRNWDTLQSMIMAHQGLAATERLTQATADWKSGAALDDTNMEEAELKRDLQKLLGDADKDLVFIPIQPCTTWDTRFALGGTHGGIINATASKVGYVYNLGPPPYDWSTYGGNPSCDGTAVSDTYGVAPYAVAYTLYTADATAQGWVTAYRDGDPDPSAATITLYYTPGPTRSTTAVTRVGRPSGAGFDIRVASRFGNVHVAASVIGYFIRSAATALECQDVLVVNNTAVGIRTSEVITCPTGFRLTGGGVRTLNNTLQTMNASSPQTQNSNSWFASVTNNGAGAVDHEFFARCCRVPGR